MNAENINLWRDSQFGDFPEGNSILNLELMKMASILPKSNDVITFFDYDDTIFNSKRRYEVMPELRQFGGKRALPEIAKKFGNQSDPTGIFDFVKALDPKNHLFTNITNHYSMKDPNHIILTAGNNTLQSEKINASFGHEPKRIIVEEAKDKPNAILEYIISRGSIPGEIVFYDDRINALKELDAHNMLEEGLGIPIFFLQAIPDFDKKTIQLEERVRIVRESFILRMKRFI